MDKLRHIAAGEFKANCLKLMQEVQRDKTSIIVTRRGKPMVKLVPIEADVESSFGCMKGSVHIIGDIIAPIDADWEASG